MQMEYFSFCRLYGLKASVHALKNHFSTISDDVLHRVVYRAFATINRKCKSKSKSIAYSPLPQHFLGVSLFESKKANHEIWSKFPSPAMSQHECTANLLGYLNGDGRGGDGMTVVIDGQLVVVDLMK